MPEGWRLVRLDDVCENRTGIRDPRKTPDDRFHYVDISSVDNVAKRIVVAKIILGKDAPSRARQIIRANDVLVATTRPNLNSVALVPKSLNNEICSTGFCVLRATEKIDSSYLFAFVQSESFIESLSNLVKGALYPAVTDKQVRSQFIPLPPTIEEQRRIAAVLDEQMKAVEQARRAVEEQLEAARLLPSTLFSEAFHGITPLTIDPLEQDAPEGWSWETLRSLARLESGHTPSRYHPEWWGGDIPWLALPDIRNLDGKTAFETSEYTNELGVANSSARILPTGTVCLSRTASVGFVTVMGRPMATSQDFVNWVCGEQLDPYFLSFILQGSRDYLLSLATGAVHKTIYVPTVKEFRICLPALAEQKRIAKQLTEQTQAVENLKESLTYQLEAIEKMPAALLRKAFGGKI